MAICKSKYKNLGTEDDKLLFKTCTHSIEYFHTYFRELKDHLLTYNKYEELYNYCCNNLTNIKNTPMSRMTTLKLINITLTQKPKNINYLINKRIVIYVYKLLKRDKEGVNKKYISYFGNITNEERNLLVTESKRFFRVIKNINLTKNSKEQKFIKNIIKKIENKNIVIPEKYGTFNSLLLYDFDNYKKEIYDLLENDYENHHKIDHIYSNYIKLLDEVKKKTREFLDNGEYELYCDFIREMQDEEEISIRYESYLLCYQNKIDEKKELKEINQDNILLEEEIQKNLKNKSVMNTNSFEKIDKISTSNSNLKNKGFFSSSSVNLTKKNNKDENMFNSLQPNFSNNFTEFEINSNDKNVYFNNSLNKENEKYKKILIEEKNKKERGETYCKDITNNNFVEDGREYQISGERKKEDINYTRIKRDNQEINLIEEEEKGEEKKREEEVEKEKEKNKNKNEEKKEEDKEGEIDFTKEDEEKNEQKIYLTEQIEQESLIHNENKIKKKEIKKDIVEDIDIKNETKTKIISNNNSEYDEEHNKLENNYCKEKEKKKSFFNENKIILDFINKVYINDKEENKTYQSDNKNCYKYRKCLIKNKEGDTSYSNSFDTIGNEIINEFNSLLNKGKKEYDNVNSYKNIEFKNTINRGNSLIWNNLIRKSNFYRLKEDFINYNKFLMEKEKETKIKTLGDLLGMNKYIYLKKKKHKKNTNEMMNLSDLNNLIKKCTKHINVEKTLGNYGEPEIKSCNINTEFKMKENTEKNKEDKKIMTELKNEDTSTTFFNKYFTIYDNIRNIQKTILKDNSLLYNDNNIEVHLEQHYFGDKGLIKFYLKNKKLVNFYDVDIQISNKMLFPLKFKFLNYEKMLCFNTTNCYEIAVKCLHIYKGFPLIKISFRMQDMFKKSIDLRFPISINKFMKKMKITKDVFNKFWDNEKFNLYKKEKIIFKKDIIDKEFIVKNFCLNDALGVCYIEDKIYFCGCYSQNSDIMENYFVLVAVEELKKKKLKITCKSNNPTLSSAILFLMILLYRNHEKK
ncbi:conserved Plasmodium protein, unknown function [Plasmodium gallinaceum]|uniref:Clathrin adaptor domain-containing protein n=1 Tax=Plasmodium gallinaceum TaxID=5849 RepID=A0A1J1GX12_PLAGA|nr:conserved Plasmodium protein, unknown function [Plasmodium gallinaceum]CRG97089.1 conserved Plasmodium protein, unknown function [Plasmodium gallinaceum]